MCPHYIHFLTARLNPYLMSGLDLRKKTIIVESLIIVFVLYALINMYFGFIQTVEFAVSTNILLYYTNWSNILAAIGAALSLYYLHKGTKLPRPVAILKLASTMMLTVTFLVVVLVLCPQGGIQILIDVGGMIFLHLFVPILAALDFLFLADMDALGKKEAVLSLVPMMLYAVGIITVLLIAGNDDLAPYPFLRIHSQPVYVTMLWTAGLFLLGYVLSYGYTKLGKRTNPSMKE